MSTSETNISLKCFSEEQLRTKTGWAAHDLDKTLNAEWGTEGFAANAEREATLLQLYLKEWESRKLPLDDTFNWAQAVLVEAKACLSGRGKPSPDTFLDRSSQSSDAVFKAIMERRSVRRWTSQPVPDEVIERILISGLWAPSACNRQSARYLVIRDQKGKDAVASVRERWLSRAPVLILVGVERSNYLPEELAFLPYMDASMVSQNILLMAHALGLGAVFVKCAEADIGMVRRAEDANCIKNLYETLNMSTQFVPVGIIGLGYPARIPKAPPRMPIEHVAGRERFNRSIDSAHQETQRKITLRQRIGLTTLEILKRVFGKLRIRIRIYAVLD